MTKIQKILWFLLTFAFLSSCSHIRSGQYLVVRKGDTLKSLSKELKVPVWALKAANPDRNFQEGEWIFVPLKWGVMSHDSYRVAGNNMLGRFNSGELLWPVPSSKVISSGYGKRWGRKHEGIDIPAREGSTILAAHDGIVVYSGSGIGGYGKLTVVAHHSGLFTVYAHASQNYTKKGQRVVRGQAIGKVGRTGRATGPHLHFEVRYDGRAVNPKNLLGIN